MDRDAAIAKVLEAKAALEADEETPPAKAPAAKPAIDSKEPDATIPVAEKTLEPVPNVDLEGIPKDVLEFATRHGLAPVDITGKSLDDVKWLVNMLDVTMSNRLNRQAMRNQADASKPAAPPQEQGETQTPPPVEQPPPPAKFDPQSVIKALRDSNYQEDLIAPIEALANTLAEAQRHNELLQARLEETNMTVQQRTQWEIAERQKRHFKSIESALTELGLTKQFGEPNTRTKDQWAQFGALVSQGMDTVVQSHIDLTGQYPEVDKDLVGRAYALAFKDHHRKLIADSVAKKITKQASRVMGKGSPASVSGKQQPYKGSRHDASEAVTTPAMSEFFETWRAKKGP